MPMVSGSAAPPPGNVGYFTVAGIKQLVNHHLSEFRPIIHPFRTTSGTRGESRLNKTIDFWTILNVK